MARFYREFVEVFGKNFTPPPVHGARDNSLIKPEDLVQQQKAWELSKVRFSPALGLMTCHTDALGVS